MLGKNFFSLRINLDYDLNCFFRENEDDGKEDEAVKIYERILKINPQHSEAQNAIKSIKGIHQEAQELGIDLK